MATIKKLACPHCGATQALAHLLPAGKKVRCADCRNSFRAPARTQRPAAPIPVAVGVAPPPEPEEHDAAPLPPQAGRINGGRLVLVLFGMLFYLVSGLALAWYCFTLNGHNDALAQPAPATPPAGEDGPPLPPTVHPPVSPANISAKQQKAINDAIAKGVWFLKDTQQANGTWNDNLQVAYAALAGLTLLECGVLASDPVVQKCVACVRGQIGSVTNNVDNYQRSLAILFLDRLGDKKDQAIIQYLALCLTAGQHPTDGGWTYSSPVLDQAMLQAAGSNSDSAKLIALLKDQKQPLADWRKTALKDAAFDVTAWDNSNTQFAVLGLWAAQRHGMPIDRTIALAEKHFRETQLHGQNGASLADPDGHNLNLDGSWYYDKQGQPGFRNSSAWPSMTCAGLLGLAMAHGVTNDPKEKKQKPLDDPAIKQGLAMLAREIDRKDEQRAPDYYFLWSLERVGVLYNLPKIDGKDWYTWGVSILLPRQQFNGSWSEGAYYGNNPTLDTCFVLLFLKRANLVKDLTSKLQLLENPK